MPKPHLEFDHLAIACHKLSAGIDYIRRVFGVEIPLGGQHEFMGTHNAVMSVGDGIYLEVIAIDPSLKVPPYPRWFGLGNPRIEDGMKDQPILMHYVLRTSDMAATLDGLDAPLREKIGPVNQGARGDLKWQITINPTGLPPEGGCLPALIEWSGRPPQYGMAQPGPLFDRLHLCHPEGDSLRHDLVALGGGKLLDDGVIDLQSTDRKSLKADFTNGNKSVWI